MNSSVGTKRMERNIVPVRGEYSGAVEVLQAMVSVGEVDSCHKGDIWH